MGLRLLGKGCHRLASPVMKDGRPISENYAWFDSSGNSSGVSKFGVDFVFSALQEPADSSKEVLKQAMLHHEVMFRNQVLELHRLYWMQKNLMNDLSWRYSDKNVVSMDNQTTTQSIEMDLFMVDSPMINSALAQSGGIFHECTVRHTEQGILNLRLPVQEHIKIADTGCLEIQRSLHHMAYGDSDSDELELTLGNKKQGNNKRMSAGKIFCGKNTPISDKDAVNMEKSTLSMSNNGVSVFMPFNYHRHITNSACIPSVRLPAAPYVTSTGRKGKETIDMPSIYHSNTDHGELLHGSSSLHLDFGSHGFVEFSSTCTVNQEPKPTCNNRRSFDLNVSQFESFPQNEVNLPSSASSSTIPCGILDGPHTGTVATHTSLSEVSNKSLEETSDGLQAGDRNSASVHSQAKESDHFTHGCGLCSHSRQSSKEKTQVAGRARNSNQDEDNLLTLKSASEYITGPYMNLKERISGSFDGTGLVSADKCPSLSPSGLYQLSNEDANKSLGFAGCHVQSGIKIVKDMSIIDDRGHKLHHLIESKNMPQKASAYSQLNQSNYKQLNTERNEEDTISSSQCMNVMSVEGAISVPLEEQLDKHNGADPIGDKLEHTLRNKACSRDNADVDGPSLSSVNGDIPGNVTSLLATDDCTCKLEASTEADHHVTLLEKSCSSSDSTEKLHEKKENHVAEIGSPIWRAAESLIQISLQNTGKLDKVAVVGQIMLEKEERQAQPQNSFDSFESIVLMLTETASDEYFPPARLSTEEETDKGTCKFKLRKRRGLRDFQKDVLPGLVSLSRHEICEDLHTIAEAVMLHELKYGFRRPSTGNWVTPARSRRSRLSYASRRQ